MHKPSWFSDGYVFVSYAPTVGINKDGEELFVVDPATGVRTATVDDRVRDDIAALVTNRSLTSTSRWVREELLQAGRGAVPVYFDDRSITDFEQVLTDDAFAGLSAITLGELIDNGLVVARQGHGSPSADLRSGEVPYIKVSDLRAGQVNINPTNRVPRVVAERFWKGSESGLAPFDILTPTRTSKNIGDFSILMPGQEEVVLTKEILVLHASDTALFDNFYLLWAMSLRAVRRQWDRLVFMQTNREDVGTRYRQIRIPMPPTADRAHQLSSYFRDYYLGIDSLRRQFLKELGASDKYHVHLSSGAAVASKIAEEVTEQERSF